jgi:hypothetical protein
VPPLFGGLASSGYPLNIAYQGSYSEKWKLLCNKKLTVGEAANYLLI